MLFALVSSAWKMIWFKYVSEFMSEKDFAQYLVEAWIRQDNPNQDVNVSRKEAISFFKKAKKHFLMSESEFKHYESLADEVTVWRGVSPGREKFGLSWTDEKEKALWFKKRFERGEKKGYLLEATVPKRHILAYIDGRGEKELVINVFKIKDLIHKVGVEIN